MTLHPRSRRHKELSVFWEVVVQTQEILARLRAVRLEIKAELLQTVFFDKDSVVEQF